MIIKLEQRLLRFNEIARKIKIYIYLKPMGTCNQIVKYLILQQDNAHQKCSGTRSTFVCFYHIAAMITSGDKNAPL